jgi:molecular chaperone DnaJ
LAVKDYYTVLGVSPVATLAEIRRAYRAMALRYHPDVNPGNTEALALFTEIKEAYEVLASPEKKQQYLEERWLAGFHARGFDQNGPLTPENILKQALRYEKHIFSQDVFRMNKHTAAEEAAALLDEQKMTLMLEPGRDDIRLQVLYALLRICERLPASLSGGVFAQAERLAAGNSALLAQVRQVRERQLTAYRWQKYNWVIALAVALLLTAMLWLLAGR